MGEPQISDNDKTIMTEAPSLASPDPRFKMVRCLGSGGMGDVHLAEDSKLRRMVAIKTIRGDLCKNEEIRKRIERECLLHAKIGSHPHIVTLFDRIEQGDQINLIMEFVEGETLQDLLNKNAASGQRLSWKDAINMAVQTLEALGRIHTHGIVHRDIKPSNIIVTRDDSGAYCAKLMDFGIARMEAEDEQSTMLTKDGTGGPGTPTYMAPEQIDPKTFGPISSATDVYAMGVMLYQILSGKPPFTGSLTEVFNGHLNRQPPAIDFHGDSSIPPVLAEVLQCALAKKPSQRFPSVKVFRDELLRVAQGTLPGGALGSVGTAGSEDTNRTMVASSVSQPARGAGAAPAQHGATLLATTGAQRRGQGTGGKIIAIIFILLILAASMFGAYLMFFAKEGEPNASSDANAPADATPAVETPAAAPAAAQPAVVPVDQAIVAPEAGAVVPPAAAVAPVPDVQTPPPAVSPTPPDVPAPAPSGGSAMDEFLKNRKASEEPAPEPAASAAPTPEPVPAVAPAAAEPPAAVAEPPVAKEPVKKAPPKKPVEKSEPAKVEPKQEEPASGGGGWKVIESKDRKVN